MWWEAKELLISSSAIGGAHRGCPREPLGSRNGPLAECMSSRLTQQVSGSSVSATFEATSAAQTLRVCVPDTILRPATKPADATTAKAGSTTDVKTAAVTATAMTTHYRCHWNEEQPTHPTTTTTTPTTTTNTTTPASTTTTNTASTTTTTTATTTTSTVQSYLAQLYQKS